MVGGLRTNRGIGIRPGARKRQSDANCLRRSKGTGGSVLEENRNRALTLRSPPACACFVPRPAPVRPVMWKGCGGPQIARPTSSRLLYPHQLTPEQIATPIRPANVEDCTRELLDTSRHLKHKKYDVSSPSETLSHRTHPGISQLTYRMEAVSRGVKSRLYDELIAHTRPYVGLCVLVLSSLFCMEAMY